ncbi:helix-turn-helix domain-containing protein [Psychroflexus sediminis]|uniref:Transcriptional regulator, AraC family n=1 Tax=Psychroflexus sediminis TaxID=470826 RepID=A0A1G7XBS4_9FLAO|nr:helix-turn-helix transcriptional regulator [Psychroflexus sediminis]SDG81574.1 transcriptional regulator, AraC family [Psychroflexus sediminis]
MKLYIQNMLDLLGEEQVKTELNKLKIPFGRIADGMIDLPQDLNQRKHNKLKNSLLPYGLKLHDTSKVILVEKIKVAIKEMLSYADGLQVLSYSNYLSLKLRHDYTYLANVFSKVNGISIQQYIIQRKIERVKFYFSTSDISLSEISYLLHYSSVAHLSGQFKKVTGLSPSCYKHIISERKGSLIIG